MVTVVTFFHSLCVTSDGAKIHLVSLLSTTFTESETVPSLFHSLLYRAVIAVSRRFSVVVEHN